MLRIHRSENGQVVFTLSGQIDKEHIAELQGLIRAENGRRVAMNLRDITLVGHDQVAFLARCEAAGITLLNCAPYIREWITRQRNGK